MIFCFDILILRKNLGNFLIVEENFLLFDTASIVCFSLTNKFFLKSYQIHDDYIAIIIYLCNCQCNRINKIV
jgi:hypothetical protein